MKKPEPSLVSKGLNIYWGRYGIISAAQSNKSPSMNQMRHYWLGRHLQDFKGDLLEGVNLWEKTIENNWITRGIELQILGSLGGQLNQDSIIFDDQLLPLKPDGSSMTFTNAVWYSAPGMTKEKFKNWPAIAATWVPSLGTIIELS